MEKYEALIACDSANHAGKPVFKHKHKCFRHKYSLISNRKP